MMNKFIMSIEIGLECLNDELQFETFTFERSIS